MATKAKIKGPDGNEQMFVEVRKVEVIKTRGKKWALRLYYREPGSHQTRLKTVVYDTADDARQGASAMLNNESTE